MSSGADGDPLAGGPLGGDQPKGGSAKCRRCGKSEHATKDCSKPRKCNVCSQRGHSKATCPQRICRKCGERGHFGPDCPQIWCSRCHSVGHTHETCQGSIPRCPRCRGPHREHACRQGIKAADRPLPPRIAFKVENNDFPQVAQSASASRDQAVKSDPEDWDRIVKPEPEW